MSLNHEETMEYVGLCFIFLGFVKNFLGVNNYHGLYFFWRISIVTYLCCVIWLVLGIPVLSIIVLGMIVSQKKFYFTATFG